MHTTTTTNQPKLTQQQENHLRRLQAACENAKDFMESCARDERLDKYMVHLMDKGISSQEITAVLYA